MTTIKCGAVTPGTTGAGGWDLSVTVTVNDALLPPGDVTLLPAQYDGAPSAWGDPSNWISGGLLAALLILDNDTLRDALDEIEWAAASAIRASGVGAAVAS